METTVSVWVAGIEWHLTIARVIRAAEHLFIEVRLSGIEDCTAIVHVRGRIVLGVTAREILERTCEWLVTRGRARSGFIELVPNASAN